MISLTEFTEIQQ